ncbi:hypothetical protein [Massilia pseudoviolaceinigra]|uniref:hypothetical protein n=1 Tax=Massilia pseudoviolaceinigra TaxID=3057165 RepID=UPI002796BA15|nr:hypothetical protein [Massilia sp. CCM 9206]MDQ1924558.1 hypothetical protein [Massilia sp. CCM 9206]
MRLAADPQHPDYNAARLGSNVYLDGVRVHDCVIADEEAGYIIRHALDEQGRLIVQDDEVMCIAEPGQVRITPHFVTAVRAPS